MEKVYNEISIKPEIVTIKRYDNAIFTGVVKSLTKDFDIFHSIIYHFDHGIYVGEWK